MTTFWCPRYPEYSLWNRDICYRFKQGVLDTDEAGAAFIRSQPMYGRLFLDHPPRPPRPERHPELKAALERGFNLCPDCEAEFETAQQLKMHTIRVHPKPKEE